MILAILGANIGEFIQKLANFHLIVIARNAKELSLQADCGRRGAKSSYQNFKHNLTKFL
jgi:hypothetical protein